MNQEALFHDSKLWRNHFHMLLHGTFLWHVPPGKHPSPGELPGEEMIEDKGGPSGTFTVARIDF